MNKAQSERAAKAHEGYLRLMAKRKNPEAFKDDKKPEPKTVKSRWKPGQALWVPKHNSEGCVVEIRTDVLGDHEYYVSYWGDLKAMVEWFEEDELEDLDLS